MLPYGLIEDDILNHLPQHFVSLLKIIIFNLDRRQWWSSGGEGIGGL